MKKTTIFRILYVCVIAALLWGLYIISQTPKDQPQPKVAAVGPTVTTDLEAQLEAWVKENGGTYGVAVQELNYQQRVVRVNALEPMPTASTYKLYVAYAILHQVEQGTLSLQVTMESGDTVQTCLRKMITISDNTCGRNLGFLAGWKTTEDLLKTKGISKTYLNNYDETDKLLETEKTSSAQDHLKLLRLLHHGKLLDKQHTDLLLEYLKKQQWRERIPAGLPDDVTVANKPGFLPGMQNDAGIVYGPKSAYVIVILSDTDEPEKLAELSKLVYTYLQK
jgi:beta-lactamase class A